MVATKLLFRLVNDKAFVMALRKVAVDFVLACEERLEIPATKSAISTRKLKAISNFDA